MLNPDTKQKLETYLKENCNSGTDSEYEKAKAYANRIKLWNDDYDKMLLIILNYLGW